VLWSGPSVAAPQRKMSTTVQGWQFKATGSFRRCSIQMRVTGVCVDRGT
jgi:hypothetical protein